MAGDKKYEIEIESKSTGGGFDQANQKAQALERTLDSTNTTLDALELQFNHATKTIETFNRSIGDGSQRGTDQFLADTADKARVAEFAFYDLDAKIEKATRTTNSASAANEKLGNSAQGGAMKLLYMGQAVDDLQYGVRGVLNNIPQLVMAFGGGAGLAGGISIAAIALSQLSNLFDETDKKAEKFQADLDQIGRNAAANILDKLDERAKALRQANDIDALNAEPDKAGREAANRAIDQRLEQLRTIAEVTQVLNQLLERQTSALETIAEGERQRTAEREAAAAKAIQAEQDKVTAAQKALVDLQRQNDLASEDAAARQQALETAREDLEVLRAKRKEYEEFQKRNTGASGFNPGGENPLVLAPTGVPQNFETWSGPSREEMDKQIKLAEVRREELEKSVGGFSQSLDGFVLKIAAAEKALREQSAASQQNIDTILQGAGVEAVTDKAQSINQGNSEIIARLQQTVSAAEGQTGNARAAADAIQAAIADGALTLKELQELPQQLQLLGGSITTNISATNATVADLVQSMNHQAAAIQQLQREAAELKRLSQRNLTPGAIR